MTSRETPVLIPKDPRYASENIKSSAPDGEPEGTFGIILEMTPQERASLSDRIQSATPPKAGHPRVRSLSREDRTLLIDLSRKTLREVKNRGGFISDLPRKRKDLKSIEARLRTCKEELESLLEKIIKRRWLISAALRQGPYPKDIYLGGEATDSDSPISIREAIRTARQELSLLLMRARFLHGRIVELGEEFLVRHEECRCLDQARREREEMEQWAAKTNEKQPVGNDLFNGINFRHRGIMGSRMVRGGRQEKD